MDPEKDRIAKEEEEREKEEKIEKDDPETLRKAREWDEYRDGKYFFRYLDPPPQLLFSPLWYVFLCMSHCGFHNLTTTYQKTFIHGPIFHGAEALPYDMECMGMIIWFMC